MIARIVIIESKLNIIDILLITCINYYHKVCENSYLTLEASILKQIIFLESYI
jgi:hypothetical protein